MIWSRNGLSLGGFWALIIYTEYWIVMLTATVRYSPYCTRVCNTIPVHVLLILWIRHAADIRWRLTTKVSYITILCPVQHAYFWSFNPDLFLLIRSHSRNRSRNKKHKKVSSNKPRLNKMNIHSGSSDSKPITIKGRKNWRAGSRHTVHVLIISPVLVSRNFSSRKELVSE